jgi:hypothetical protein
MGDASQNIGFLHVWQIPPRSPDLNPVEKFWAWLRKKLRAMDLADLRDQRPPVARAALKLRARALLRTSLAKGVASRTFKSLLKTCAEVVKKGGAASRG